VAAEGGDEFQRARSLRPWFLVAAMLLVWLVGVQGVSVGCQSTMTMRSGVVVDEKTAIDEARVDGDPSRLGYVMQAARLRAMVEHRSTQFPLGVGRLVLSLVLVASAATALSGRPGSRAFTMQAIAVNAAFGVLDYVLSQPVRATAIDAVVRVANELFQEVEHAPFRSASFWFWIERVRVAMIEVGVAGVGLAALASPKTAAFFEAMESVRRAREREREDEP
jgi:hypothetical protein